MAEATQPGATDGLENPNPRDAIIANVEQKLQQEREGDIKDYQEALHEEETPTDPDGAASVAPLHDESPPEAPPALPQDLEGDPLADYVVMHEGKPMFKVRVDGQDMMMPLDRARQQIQKHEAAEVRLQNAAALQRQLDERAQALEENEAAFNAKIAEQTTPPPVDVEIDDDDTLLAEAKDVLTTMFQGNEDDAAQKLTTLLKQTRTPAQPQAPVIDPKAIVKEATAAAVQEISDADKQRDLQTGYAQFKNDFPDIIGDQNLYVMADRMTDEIQAEHPDWLPSQLMQESGKRTRDWVAKMKGNTSQEPPIDTDTNTTRQERKEDLVPIPTAAAGAQQPLGEPGEEPEQTPQEVIAEMRESRGQPT